MALRNTHHLSLRIAAPLALLVLLLLLTGCSRFECPYERQGPEQFVIDSYKISQGKFAILELEGIRAQPLDPAMMQEYTDVIAEDDVLDLAIFHPSRLDLMEAVQRLNKGVGYRVSGGAVQLPDVGLIAVRGLTREEARRKIEKIYCEQIDDVEVFLDYKQRLSHKVELVGMINQPNIPVDGQIRLFEVLSKAKMPDTANLFMSYVVRDGKPLSVDLHKLVREGDMSQNIVMRGGDKIFIAPPTASTAMVMGEVAKPKVIPLTSGSISLREALVAAGGIPFTGDKRSIQVIRGNTLRPRIYTLNWYHILHLPNDSLLLMPGDTVFVGTKPITRWNRFISQLLPSFYGIQSAYMASQMLGWME